MVKLIISRYINYDFWIYELWMRKFLFDIAVKLSSVIHRTQLAGTFGKLGGKIMVTSCLFFYMQNYITCF